MALSGFGKYCQTCSTNIEQAVVNDNPDILRNRQIMRITKCRAFCELLPLKKNQLFERDADFEFQTCCLICIAIRRGVEVMTIYYFILK